MKNPLGTKAKPRVLLGVAKQLLCHEPQGIQGVIYVNQKQAFDATQKAMAFCCGTKWVATSSGG